MSPGHLDVVLAAVRHQYRQRNLTPPQEKLGPKAYTSLRNGYATFYSEQREVRTATPPLKVQEYRALCEVPPFSTRAAGVTATAALLSLDHELSAGELAAVGERDLKVNGSTVRLTAGDRALSFECTHHRTRGVVVACTCCVLRHYAALAPSTDTTALLGTGPDHSLGSAELRLALYGRLYGLASCFPALRLEGTRKDAGTLRFEEASCPDDRLGTRYALAQAFSRDSRRVLVAQTGLKLAACRGLTPGDLFDHLTIGTVDLQQAPGGEHNLRLLLPPTLRGRSQDAVWIHVLPQGDPTLCAVAAVRRWLLIRRASGHLLNPGDALLVPGRGWFQPSSAGLSRTGELFDDLAAAAGLGSGYRWESARELHISTLVTQRATEAQLYRTLRLKKPEQMRRAIAPYDAAATDAARRAAGACGGVE